MDNNTIRVYIYDDGHVIYYDKVYHKYIVYKDDQFLHKFDTQHEAHEYIENGDSTPLNLKQLNKVPTVGINTWKRKGGRNYHIDDVVYSTEKGKWVVKASYYNDSIDSGRMSFDEDEWYNEDED